MIRSDATKIVVVLHYKCAERRYHCISLLNRMLTIKSPVSTKFRVTSELAAPQTSDS